jgi:hypothetical protein
MSFSDILNLGIGIIIVLFIIGLIPAFIAYNRKHAYRHIILIICLFGSWSGILWLIAFIWSVWPSDKSLIDPVVGNVAGTGQRSTGHSIGEVQRNIETTLNRGPTNGVTLSTQTDTRDCPICAETIKAAAKLCRYCQSSIEPMVNQGQSSDLLIVATNSALSETNNLVSSPVEITPTKPVAATCPNCHGAITSITEACTHCNTWLGVGSGLKPEIVKEESKLNIQNNNNLASGISQEFKTSVIVEEFRADKRVNPIKPKKDNLLYLLIILIFLAIVIYFYRAELTRAIYKLSSFTSAIHPTDYSKRVCSSCGYHGAIRVTEQATESVVDEVSKRILTDKLLDTLPVKNRYLGKYKAWDGVWYLSVGNFETADQGESFIKKLKPYGVEAWVGCFGGC